MKEVFAGCYRPLLVTGPSRHYLCNPCVGAWTHTPPCSSGAHTHFFPEDSGLTSRKTRSAHEKIPAMPLQQGAVFRGCNHSFIFRLPHSLGLQVAPTVAFTMPGGQAVYTTHRPGSYPTRDVVSLRVRHGQLTRLDSQPAGLQPCRLLLPALRSSELASQHSECFHPCIRNRKLRPL